ncbi:hypothetical protein PFICI_08815 [Pestalotiopsis fici W106-1]|uniref:Ima1 N-terminal domain-containing protein n=1 Tax=Pestalotiopsis fici (strain W106-1 / CGMCC3.15140) TaxID=1229662 RepID=W3X0R0_PESFW|nr:uncharacterized protein PFICI_08815 [Pestalotiopsis fici W106-1]ETS78962.1 hypothetical protein PFICI_08815 [Pestalotiopsis fici W106-1]
MVPTLRSRSRNLLSCFYCGRRSDIIFTGQKSFECRYCEARNWLDKNGGITDPPASSTAADAQPAAPIRIATSPNASIFCATCQRNQEILARTLKEYEFPDDPNDSEYAARMRGYRTWKRDLEARYPQVCIDCEPKVEEQLRKASYTAKTDHMRRLIDRTKQRRHQARTRTALDYVDMAGKWIWHFGFLLQALWHIVALGIVFVEHGHGSGNNFVVAVLRETCAWIIAVLPRSDRFIKLAINTSLVAFAWNPRFKQTIRGFTSHILGFRQWYTYQLVIILIRCACLFLSQYNDVEEISAIAQLGAHLVIGWLVFYVYNVAGKAIRTDNSSLFGLFGTRQAASYQERSPRVAEPAQRPSNDMAGVLDEILDAPPAAINNIDSSPTVATASPYYSVSRGGSFVQNGSFGTPSRHHQDRVGNGFGSLSFSSPPISPGVQTQPTRNGDEMDWSPSGSQHRAFSTHNPYKVKNPNPRFANTPLGFNDTPIDPKPGAFWYKVPPAPTTPAQRLRNPPKPVIRESPKERQDSFFASPRRTLDLGGGSQQNDSGFILKDASFYAPGPKDDPRDGLSNMMGSFSISPDPEDRRAAARKSTKNVILAADGTPVTLQNNSKERMAELVVLFGALWSWVTALGTEESYGPTLGLGAICACLIVSIRLTADLLVNAQVRHGKQPTVFSLSWATLGYAQVFAALALVWKIWATGGQDVNCGMLGNALLGVMIAHQFWHVFS